MLHSRTLRIVTSVVFGVLFVVGVFGLRVGMAYWSIERDEFDPDSARCVVLERTGVRWWGAASYTRM